MKRIIALALLLIFALAAVCSAETLTTLKAVQDTLLSTAPRQLLYGADVKVSLTGTIVEVTPAYEWFIYRVECPGDGSSALILGYDEPCFLTRGYDLELGDTVRVTGVLNVLYSSHLLPFIGQAELTRLS